MSRGGPSAPRALALRALALLALAAPAARADDDGRLVVRVVTFNAWGLPVGAPDRAARIARLGPALAALRPHVVALQELWLEGDLDRVQADLAAAGLPHARRFPSRAFGSGLLLASVWPLQDATFTQFTLGGKPHAVWHADWWGGKGVGRARVTTPLGALLVADTHLHARYGTDEYLPTQVGQALELGAALGDFGADPPAALFDAARPPLVLLGDLNAGPADLPFRLACARAALEPVAPDLGIDWVLVRPGGALAVRPRRVARCLDAPVDLGDGRAGRLSDHAGVVADLELRRLDAAPRHDPRPAGRAAWAAAAAEARPLLEAERDAARARLARGRTRLALAVAATGAAAAAAHARRRRRGGCALQLLALLLLHGATWLAYLGPAWEGSYAAGLEAALAALP